MPADETLTDSCPGPLYATFSPSIPTRHILVCSFSYLVTVEGRLLVYQNHAVEYRADCLLFKQLHSCIDLCGLCLLCDGSTLQAQLATVLSFTVLYCMIHLYSTVPEPERSY